MRVPVVIEDQSLLPAYARPGDAGADLRCTAAFHLAPGERTLVGTGVRLAIPEGYVGLVTPRSGLAARSGLGIVNSPGVIDAGFRGEVQVCLINLDPMTPIEGAAGDRIAQLVVIPFVTASFEAVKVLDETVRGCGGYGSTGTGHVAPHDTGGPDR